MNPVDLLNFAPATISTVIILYALLWAFKNPKKVRDWGHNLKEAHCWISNNFIPSYKRWRKAQFYEKPLNRALKGWKEEVPNAGNLKAKVNVDDKLLDERPIVNWVNSTVFVSVPDNRPTPRSFVVVVMEFVKTVVLPNVRRCMEREEDFVVVLVLTMKMLEKSKKKGALTCFSEEFLVPSLNNKVVHRLYEKLLKIDERGWFTRILVIAFQSLETIFYLPERCEKLKVEIRFFINYLYRIAIRERGEHTKLSFFGEHIKVSIILVGSFATKTLVGIEAYSKRLNEELNKGISLIFIIGVGEWNVDVVEEILRATPFKVEFPYPPKSYQSPNFGNLPAVCVPLYRKDWISG